MKFGMRKPSLKKSLSARTKGRLTRQVKRALIPGYGKRGMGWLHPKRAMYNRVYRRTTFGVGDVARVLSSGTKTRRKRKESVPAVPATPRPTRAERSQDLTLRLSVLTEAEQQEANQYVQSRMPKKKTAYLLCIFTGLLGGHRYYLKSYAVGIMMAIFLVIFPLLTVVWWLIDLVRLSGMVDDRILDLTDDIVTTIEKRHFEAEHTAAAAPLVESADGTSDEAAYVVPVEAWYPEDTEKFQRNDAETEFLRQLYRQVKEVGLSPNLMDVHRLSDGTLKFTYADQEIGRIRLQKRKHTMTYWQNGSETQLEGQLEDFLPLIENWILAINRH